MFCPRHLESYAVCLPGRESRRKHVRAVRTYKSCINTIRKSLLALLVFGLVGTGVELLLLGHYEEAWQLVPLGLIGAGLVVLAWDAMRSTAATRRIVRITMVLFVLAGGVGVVLHYRGNLEFQLEIDASQSRWDLFRKVMQAKAPPALAPGVMTQLGLLGLIYTIGASHDSHE
jgi:hypothetical protein